MTIYIDPLKKNIFELKNKEINEIKLLDAYGKHSQNEGTIIDICKQVSKINLDEIKSLILK